MRARSLAFVALLALPALAGCVSQSVQPQGLVPGPLGGLLPPAQTLCHALANGTACNYIMTPQPERQGNEVTIAVSRKDPLNVVGGAKDYTPDSAGQCVWDGVYATHDGGKTWDAKNVPGSPWVLLSPNASSFAPNLLTQYWCLTDPSYAFGPDGTLYAGVMAYQGDPVTASKIGDGTLPTGGINDFAFNRVTQAIAISHDGGTTIDAITAVDSGTFPATFHDREWVAASRSGNVYDTWTTGALEGNLLYRSTDGGKSFQGPVFLDGLPQPLGDPNAPGGMYVATGPKDEVAVSGCSQQGPKVAVSTDGGQTFTPWTLVAKAEDKGMTAPFRAGMVCMLAMDDSDGPFSKSIYVVWSDTRNGDRDVYLSLSRDLGTTWSDAVRVNQGQDKADQFFPAIAVNPNGVVDVAFYDRQYSNNTLNDVSFTYSRDGGKTWAPESRVTERSSDPKYSHHQSGAVFIGDYMDIDSSVDCAWPVWVDTSVHPKADVMTSCVQRPGTVQP
jgi:hypothetical protein